MSRDSQAVISITQTVAAALIVGGLLTLMVFVNPVQSSPDDRIKVIVSILPQKEFVEAVGGEHVSVTVMVPPGSEPHTYSPTPAQMVSLTNADLYFEVGSGLEFELTWMDRFVDLNDRMLVVDGAKGIRLIDSGGSATGLKDPHIWLSPKNAEAMVQNLYHGLLKIDPRNASGYENNTRSYLQRLDSLDGNISSILAPVENKNLLVFHPAWGYFADEYGLTQVAIEAEGKDPTALELADIVDYAKRYNVSVVFAEPQFSTRLADEVAKDINGAVVIVDDLAGDYVRNLQHVADKIAEGLSNNA
jgi:zinc transport system substrate-binding protein